MNEYLRQIISQANNHVESKNLIREYLQSLILQSLQELGFFNHVAFQGGTALRFLYNLPRYSEDLDFSLVYSNSEFLFTKLLKKLNQKLFSYGYEVNIKFNDQKIVNSAFINFTSLLYELDLSNHQDEKLSIKIEIDTAPPKGAEFENTLIRKYEILNLFHFDKPSLLSGKIHAVLERPCYKGRDIYDLFWYLTDKNWPNPNFKYLNNALNQTNWLGEQVSEENWRRIILRRIKIIPFDEIIKDVQPFVINQNELKMLNIHSFEKLLK